MYLTKILVPLWRCVGLLAGAAGLLIASAAPALADVELGVEELEADAKEIRVGKPGDNDPLRVALEPVDDAFAVDEPITFTAHGNKDFFLYLFSIDKDTGDATIILPSKEGQKHNKYPAGQTLPVPNRGEADFLADEAGRETLVMVASTKYLPLKSNWFREGADSYVGKAEDFEEEFAEKAIRVGREDRTRDENVVVKRLSVRIHGEEAEAEAPDTSVWLTTKGNRQEYDVGERIEAVFGTEADGWVQMYVVEPSGKHSRLKTVEVEEGQTYTMRAVAEEPSGKHAFVAVYTEDAPSAGKSLSGAKSVSLVDASPKGVRLEDDEPATMAVYRFRISDD